MSSIKYCVVKVTHLSDTGQRACAEHGGKTGGAPKQPDKRQPTSPPSEAAS